jgi:hypothetical protein
MGRFCPGSLKQKRPIYFKKIIKKGLTKIIL